VILAPRSATGENGSFMTAVFDRVYEGFWLVFSLQFAAMCYVDRAQLKSRMAGLLGSSKSLPAMWRWPTTDKTILILFCWAFLHVVTREVQHPANQPSAPWPLWQKVVLGTVVALLVAFIALAVNTIVQSQRHAVTSEVSRGVLLEGIRKMYRKPGFSTWSKTHIYVLPDMSQARWCALLGGSVLIPRQLLDSMSRREIDALAAWQLCRQSARYYLRPFWALLGCDAVAVGLADWLLPNWVARDVALLALLAVQIAALAVYLPRSLEQADYRAVELTRDPEAFLSAMAGMRRFRGVPVKETPLEEMAQRFGIAPERVPALVAERTAPAEDRYPTAGSYMITGLQ
jgi:Zn-dependent protease with chaperone function